MCLRDFFPPVFPPPHQVDDTVASVKITGVGVGRVTKAMLVKGACYAPGGESIDLVGVNNLGGSYSSRVCGG